MLSLSQYLSLQTLSGQTVREWSGQKFENEEGVVKEEEEEGVGYGLAVDGVYAWTQSVNGLCPA